MIIDFEHHYTPYEIWKKRGGKAGETVRVFSSDGRAVRSIYDTSHNIETHLKHMDMAGIDMAVLTGSADSMEEVKLYDESCAKVVKQYPKRFVGFAATFPLAGKEALSELDKAVKDFGLKGIMMNAQVGNHPLDSRELWPFYKKVSELDIPIFIHISQAVPGFDACKAPYDLNRSLVREFELMLATTRLCLGGVLEEFPNLKFIVAHFGGGISSVKERLDRYIGYWGAKFWTDKPLIKEPYVERFNEHLSKLYFDMAGREIGIDTIKCALTNISPKRLLFATDYPVNFVDDPVGMKTYIQKIKQLEIPKESIEAMLGKNGVELLGL